MILQRKILIRNILKTSSGFIFFITLAGLFFFFENIGINQMTLFKPALLNAYAPDFIEIMPRSPLLRSFVNMIFPVLFFSSILTSVFYFLGSLLFIPPARFIPDEPVTDQEKLRHKVWPRLSHLDDVFYICPHALEEVCYRDLAAENISLDAPRFKKIPSKSTE